MTTKEAPEIAISELDIATDSAVTETEYDELREAIA